jgi:ribose transport system substrate-binding protein
MVAMAVFVSACGGDDSSSDSSSSTSTTASGSGSDASGSDAQAAAKAAVDEAKQVPEFTFSAPPLDISKVAGKKLFLIPLASTIPYVDEVDKAMMRIAQEHGVEVTEFKNEGNPTQWATGVSQAIAQKADLIFLQAAPDPTLLIPQLKAAKDAGIPVVLGHLYEDGTEPPASVKDLLTAYITAPFAHAAKLSVDYAVAETGCDKLNVLIMNSEEIAPSTGIVEAMQSQLDERCPEAKSVVRNVPAVEWGTKLQPEVQSALTKDPTINWVLPVYDSMSVAVSAAITGSGKGGGAVRIASYNNTPDILKLIGSGDIVVADSGESTDWLAHAYLDQAWRVLGAGPVIADGNEELKVRMFDDSNISEAGSPPQADQGFGTSYKEGYEKLWGVQG